MTDRHPLDCLVTPPDAAIAMGRWLADAEPSSAHEDPHPLDEFESWLDPFAGPGALLEWSLFDPAYSAVVRANVHAWDIDERWGPELCRRVPGLNVRLGRDSLQMDWLVRGRRPNIMTNPPYKMAHEAIARAAEYSAKYQRWVCMLLRTDIWQHPEPPLERCADFYLSLKWRPLFGLNKHGRMGSESSGSQWNVWTPRGRRYGGDRALEFLLRPPEFAAKPLQGVAAEMVAEHRRLARLAHQMGAAMAQGATP